LKTVYSRRHSSLTILLYCWSKASLKLGYCMQLWSLPWQIFPRN